MFLAFKILVVSRRNVRINRAPHSVIEPQRCLTLRHLPKFIDHTLTCAHSADLLRGFVTYCRPKSTHSQKRMWQLNYFLLGLLIVAATWVTVLQQPLASNSIYLQLKSCHTNMSSSCCQLWGQSSIIWGLWPELTHIPVCCGCCRYFSAPRPPHIIK